jgi:Chitinase class I
MLTKKKLCLPNQSVSVFQFTVKMRSFKILIFTVGSLGGLFSTGMAQGVSSIITSSMYNQMLPHRNMFYTYNAFIKAANAFSGFGMTGDLATRKTELAAFFGEASHETNG